MNRIMGIVKKISDKLFTKQMLRATCFMLIGVVIGLGGSYLVWQKNDESNSKLSKPAPLTTKELNERREQLSKDQYSRAKDMVNADLQKKRITKEQADSINAKLEEMKAFLAKTDHTSKEGREKIRAKREELRKWAQQNNLSIKYTLFVY